MWTVWFRREEEKRGWLSVAWVHRCVWSFGVFRCSVLWGIGDNWAKFLPLHILSKGSKTQELSEWNYLERAGWIWRQAIILYIQKINLYLLIIEYNFFFFFCQSKYIYIYMQIRSMQLFSVFTGVSVWIIVCIFSP